MPRHFKIDRPATALANFTDARSYLSLRTHPGTDHPCQYLFGDDVSQLRRVIYERDHHRCILKLVCMGLNPLPFDGDIFHRWHLEHKEGGNDSRRCSCPENVRGACYACHIVKDGRQPRFSKGAK